MFLSLLIAIQSNTSIFNLLLLYNKFFFLNKFISSLILSSVIPIALAMFLNLLFCICVSLVNFLSLSCANFLNFVHSYLSHFACLHLFLVHVIYFFKVKQLSESGPFLPSIFRCIFRCNH